MKNTFFILPWEGTKCPLEAGSDQIALFLPTEYQNIFGKPMIQMGNHNVEGLIKISHSNKSIYRKYVGNSDFPEADDVMLNHRSLAELGIDPTEAKQTRKTVTIEPANAFAYLWNNSYSYIRYPFRWAVSGLVLTVIFGLGSVLFDIINLLTK